MQTSPQTDQGAFSSAQDTQYTSGSPLACVAGVKIFLPCDALGPLTLSYKMPQLWKPGESGFRPEGENFSYLLRISFTVRPAAGAAMSFACALEAAGFPIIGDIRRTRAAAVPQESCFSFPVGIPAPGAAILGQIAFTPEAACDIYNIRMAAFRLGS